MAIKEGSKGQDVERWQNFLRGQDLYMEPADGSFGPATKKATVAYQAKHGLTSDGVVGSITLGAAIDDGYDDSAVEVPDSDWPTLPSFTALSQVEKGIAFGRVSYVIAPTPECPEGIRILEPWVSDHIVKVEVPQLKGLKGAPKDCKVLFHKDAAEPLKALWQAWEDADLLGYVISWGGGWAPRFVRGSKSVLSNHAIATAFDINAQWNGLGVNPPPSNKKGSVRPLVNVATDLSWYWGGFWANRRDGMHFELVVR
jgi:hypothetical protein